MPEISQEGSNSIYSMHTIHIIFNNSSSIMVGMNSKKIEKEKLVIVDEYLYSLPEG